MYWSRARGTRTGRLAARKSMMAVGLNSVLLMEKFDITFVSLDKAVDPLLERISVGVKSVQKGATSGRCSTRIKILDGEE
jgi:hypothetical protein